MKSITIGMMLMLLSFAHLDASDQDIRDLVRRIESNEEGIRYQAIVDVMAQATKAEAIVPSLIGAIANTDTNAQSRWIAVKALGSMGEKAKTAIPTVIRCLGDPNSFVHRQAPLTLAQIGADAVPALSEVLKDDHQTTSVHSRAREAISLIGSSAVPALVEALRESSEAARYRISIALAGIGGEAVPGLVRTMRERQPPVSVGALVALNAMTTSINEGGKPLMDELIKAIPALVDTLHDRDVNARLEALQALGRIGPAAEEAYGDIEKVFQDQAESSLLRNWAAFALSRINPGNTQLIGILIRALREEKDPTVRRGAVDALGHIGPRSSKVIPALISAFADSEGSVQRDSRWALQHIGQDAVPDLVLALDNENRSIRYSAVVTLGDIGSKDRSAVSKLKKLQGDDDPGIAQEAKDALRKISMRRRR